MTTDMSRVSAARLHTRSQLAPVRGASRRRDARAFWAFVGPMALGVVVFVLVPIVWGLWLSLSAAQATITPTGFVGLANYSTILQNKSFRGSLIMIATFALLIVPLTIGFSLLLALLIDAVPRGKGFFRTVIFIPTACSYVVASAIWKISLFNGLPSGFANTVFRWFGLDPVVWVGGKAPAAVWVVLVTVRLWLQSGFYMILFTAGLQEIPQELYEASRVDGVRNRLQELRYITLPLLRNTTVAIMMLCLIGAFQAFDEFYNILLLGGQSAVADSLPPLVYLYQVAFGSQNYGLGSAGAFILTAIIIVFTLLQGKLFGVSREER
ncbi:MAG: sugar ABC transporter permease [Propionibacteriaceae bacterium]|jgi:multiple sugar transport system permease protein|nr:sugar ABC transporter permease [Propionibacteriaceae bacterium]